MIPTWHCGKIACQFKSEAFKKVLFEVIKWPVLKMAPLISIKESLKLNWTVKFKMWKVLRDLDSHQSKLWDGIWNGVLELRSCIINANHGIKTFLRSEKGFFDWERFYRHSLAIQYKLKKSRGPKKKMLRIRWSVSCQPIKFPIKCPFQSRKRKPLT